MDMSRVNQELVMDEGDQQASPGVTKSLDMTEWLRAELN